MSYQQEEYQEELEKVQDKDFIHDWVSSSAFLFYLSLFCLVVFSLGGCYRLYNQRYENVKLTEIVVPESTQYSPKYK